jgi:hypothetical protein
VPYRIDLHVASDEVLDRLVDLGALDGHVTDQGTIAALMPDSIPPDRVATALGVSHVSISPVTGRDADSVWVLHPRPLRIRERELKLIDAAIFGTGLHPTTALCLELLEHIATIALPHALLDVGTGSGVLALAALILGMPRAVGVDVDPAALKVAAENARVNGLSDRLELSCGGPQSVAGMFPLVMANVLAAPLIEMAPQLVRRVSSRGQLVLSGIASSLEEDVTRSYCGLGMRCVQAKSRGELVRPLVFTAPLLIFTAPLRHRMTGHGLGPIRARGVLTLPA